MQNALKCANLGGNLICCSHNVNTYIFVDFALLKLSLCMTLYRKNKSVSFLTCLSSLAPKRESQTGGTGRGPQSNVTAQCQKHHNRGSVCEEKSKWAHTLAQKHTQKHPSAPGQTATDWPAAASQSIDGHCASSNRNLLQKPVTVPHAGQSKISQRLREIQSCFSFFFFFFNGLFKLPPPQKKNKILSQQSFLTQSTQSQQGTFPGLRGLSRTLFQGRFTVCSHAISASMG